MSLSIEDLRMLAREGQLAHAYLLTGPRGIGKQDLALELACIANCDDAKKARCECGVCRRIRQGSHPDILWLKRPEDKTEILIGQLVARSPNLYDPLLPKFSLRPYEGLRKVLIVLEAQEMNAEAANCFLKTLEEPSGEALIILTSSFRDGILPTIRSRCQEIRFFAQANSELASHMESHYDVRPLDSLMLARFSGGVSARAQELKKDFFENKNRYLDDLFRLPAEVFIKQYSAEKDKIAEICDVWAIYFRDVLFILSGANEDVVFHRDRLADIHRYCARTNTADVQSIIRQVMRLREAANDSFNVKIAMTILKEMI